MGMHIMPWVGCSSSMQETERMTTLELCHVDKEWKGSIEEGRGG